GDATMALAFFLLIAKTGTLDFGPVFGAASSGALSNTVVTLVALGLLGGAPRPRHPARRRSDRARPVGHQARHRILDDEPDRLHVRRGRRGRVPVRDVPSHDPRVLQGAPLPDGR